MTKKFKLLLILIMTTALAFGYLNLFLPPELTRNFERLHIFLFNLCAGGGILIYFSEYKKITFRCVLFMLLAATYAVLAFFKMYIPAMALGFILSVLVELVRAKRFSWLPRSFFTREIPVSQKFHHAALLCLSMGLCMSSLVILNNIFLHLVHLEKLTLDTFFLGFSFPISLISMSVIFSLMHEDTTYNQDPTGPNIDQLIMLLKNSCFWVINLGVLIFFLFILFELNLYQVMVTSILFCSVSLVLGLYWNLGGNIQQKHFLTSGILFLVGTAITGIIYIALTFSPEYVPNKYTFLLRIHAFMALYGWNLSGLAVLMRKEDFPIKLHSGKLVLFHWFTVLILCPLGVNNRVFAIAAVVCYAIILYFFMFSQGVQDKRLVKLGS
ncbi:MAG: hypothetical protein PF442_13535 [Desulfobulbaceae bacterium]|jgi:hypothetical protein|nr:hypothetical protein [Desulfobulbaceae bacterium]